jgi:hypothetical protein
MPEPIVPAPITTIFCKFMIKKERIREAEQLRYKQEV